MNKPSIMIRRISGSIPALWSDEGDLIGVLNMKADNDERNAAFQIQQLLCDHYGTEFLHIKPETDIRFEPLTETLYFSWKTDEDDAWRDAQLTWTRI
jgi:hypothetical protein